MNTFCAQLSYTLRHGHELGQTLGDGEPDLPVAPQEEAGLTLKIEQKPRGQATLQKHRFPRPLKVSPDDRAPLRMS